MRIVVLCEGKTEQALRHGLREFIHGRTPAGRAKVGIDLKSLEGHMLQEKLGRLVEHHLRAESVAGVVALTDVYPEFDNAAKAKEALRSRVGRDVDKSRVGFHAAQYDLEAWLLPSWDDIAKDLKVEAKPPDANPESVNGHKPPSMHLKELYRKAGDRYEKDVDAAKYLTADRLETSYKKCPELKAFLNSLLTFAGAPRLE